MRECKFQSRLGAFHDRELDADTAGQLQSHLAECPECSGQLESMRSVSRWFNERGMGQLSPIGLARLHAAADVAATEARRRDLFPLAKALIGVAASVLIIAGAWLVEMPKTVGPTVVQQQTAPAADWERLASGDHLEVQDGVAPNAGLADATFDATFSDFMVKGLQPEGGPYENRSH